MLNLKPLFRPISVNLKCFADSEHYNFPEDMSSAPSDTKISLKTDREVQATSSTQQLGRIGSARGCIPGNTLGSCWCCLQQSISRVVQTAAMEIRDLEAREELSPGHLAVPLSLSAGLASEVSLPASTPTFITVNYNNLALL